MKKFFTWLKILTKRQLANPFFLALLIILPLTALISDNFSSKDKNTGYIAGLYIDGESDDIFADTVVNNLVNANDSIRFVKFNNVEDMKEKIISEELICGYVIPHNIRKLLSGDDKEGSITSYMIPASTLQPAANEIVYAELIKMQGYSIIKDYMHSSGQFPDDKYIEEAFEYYEEYLTGNETIRIDYEEYGTDKIIDAKEISTGLVFPVRGIMSVLVFLAGLFGSVLYLKDKENGVFQTITKGYQNILRILYPFIPAFLFGVAMTVSVISSDNHKAVGMEIICMLGFVLGITLFAFLLTIIARKSRILGSCIPVILLCCLVFCPIFINLKLYLPVTEYVQKLFVPYYYLIRFM